MSCHRIHEGDVDAYVHGELSAENAIDFETHSLGCQDCSTELRNLRQEKRIFQLRADADDEQLPAFADVMARMVRDESAAIAEDPEPGRVVVLAKPLRPRPPPKKTEHGRKGERKYVVSRWAQAIVVCAASAAAAWSLLGVTSPKTEDTAVVYPRGYEMEIGADPICTPENSSASAEILASLPPPHEVATKMPSTNPEDPEKCGDHVDTCESGDKPAEPGCDEESSAVCGESGP